LDTIHLAQDWILPSSYRALLLRPQEYESKWIHSLSGYQSTSGSVQASSKNGVNASYNSLNPLTKLGFSQSSAPLLCCLWLRSYRHKSCIQRTDITPTGITARPAPGVIHRLISSLCAIVLLAAVLKLSSSSLTNGAGRGKT
jgi:hypothetical protein